MKMAQALMECALASLDEGVIAESLKGTVVGLWNVLGIESGSFRSTPRRSNRRADGVDGWSLPDAIWVALCRERPYLRHYPLGESCERATKRTLASLLQEPSGTLAPGKKGVERRLATVLKEMTRDGFARRLAAELFFEICVDRLRRPGPLAYGYEFTRRGGAVSLPTEWKLRRVLARQCSTVSRKFLRGNADIWKGRSSERQPDRVGKAGDAEPKKKTKKKEETEGQDKKWVNVLAGPIAHRLTIAKREFSVDEGPTRMLLHEDSPYSVSFSFEPFENFLARRLRSRVRDLLDVGVAVYISDLHTPRDAELSRRTGLLLSVRHPEAWKDAAGSIQRAVSYLGREDFRIYFKKRAERTRRQSYKVAYNKRCVCLFSGGLDSLAGAVWALQEGLRPILVSHYAQPRLAGIQKQLVGRLKQHFGCEIDHVCFYASKHKRKKNARGKTYNLGRPCSSVMAQHLRSFVFLSAGAAVALESGTRHVYIFENGPVALNPSICEGGVNTQTAHPHVLAEFRSLVREIFGEELEIRNPFAYLTKGEVLRYLNRRGLRSLVAETHSCWDWFNVRLRANRLGLTNSPATHDGTCLACLIRRAAAEAAHLRGFDAPYLTDVFSAYPNLDFDTTLAVADLLRFCRTVLALEDDELLKRVPELSVYEEGTDCRKLAAMLRRHAREVRDGFDAQANKAFHRDFQPLL